MPVKDLTERRSVPRVGKLHLGIKETTKGGKEYPKAVDYFVCHADGTTPPDAAKAFADVYGDEPRELDIMFISDDPLQLPDAWRKMYSQTRGLLCKGDGETASAKWDLQTDGERPEGVEAGTWAGANTVTVVRQTIVCLGDDCPMSKAKKCKVMMNLQIVLPDVRGIGVWQIDTGSFNSIRNVLDNIRMIQAAVGTIRGVPLKLRLGPLEVTPEQGPKHTVFVMDISLPEMSLRELTRARMGASTTMLLAPPIDDEEVPDDIVADVEEATGEVAMSAEERAEAEAAQAAVEPDPQVPEGTPEFMSLGDLFNTLYKQHNVAKYRALQLAGFADVDGLVGLDLQHVYLKVCKKGNITPLGGRGDGAEEGGDEAEVKAKVQTGRPARPSGDAKA